MCCVWQFSLQCLVNPRVANAFNSGCTIKRCGMAHCNKCSDELHPVNRVYFDAEDSPAVKIILV